MLARGRDQGRTTGAALGSCNGHGCTRNPNGRGILNGILKPEPSRFGVALEPHEIASKFGRGLVAQFAILLQQLADDIFQLGWYCRIQPYRWPPRLVVGTVEDCWLRFARDSQVHVRRFM